MSSQLDRPSRVVTRAKGSSKIDVRIASHPHELEAAFELVYDSYVKSGLSLPNQHRMRVTEYQLQETSEVFLAMMDNEAVGTVSLIGDGLLGLPLEDIYGEEVEEIRRDGIQVAEVSCLADRRHSTERSLLVLLKMMTLLAQHAQFRQVDRLLIAVHPRHVPFYRRMMGFEQIGGLKKYGMVMNRPAVALSIDLTAPTDSNSRVYQQFFGERYPLAQLLRTEMRDPRFTERMRKIAESSHSGSLQAVPMPA